MIETIRRFIIWIVLILASLLLIAFALANRGRVSLSLFPFGDAELPLFLILFLSVLFGSLLGGFIVWNAQRPWRALSRRQEKEIDDLREEIAALKSAATRPPGQGWQIPPPF